MNTLTSPAISLRPSPRSQRSSSISNDRSSLSVVSLVCPPAVEPEPAYIAPSSASQIVTGDREPMFEDDDQDRPGHSAATNTLVAPNALLLLNAFLDQLLYSILVASRSTSIAALRPAVNEVLKPRLAKDAIASANEELHAFDGDNDELSAFHEELEARAGWDLTKIWRRTRLRCMVYTHLGDLEEQDEKEWLQRENDAHDVDSQHRLSRDLGVVSPTAAIFLTSILEYIAEQVLLLSAEAAYTRFEARQRQDKHGVAGLAGLQRPSVEVVDIEKLAVNTTFGRLWRSWKRRVRSPSVAKQRRSSLEYFLRPNSSLSTNDSRSREPSVGEEKDHNGVHDAGSGAAAADHPQSVHEAAAIPLPTTKYDAREIEGVEFPWQNSRREMIERPHSVLLSSDKYRMVDEHDENRARGARRELLQRNRSSSLPPAAYGQHLDPQQSLYASPREDLFPHEPRAHSPSRSRSGSDAPAVMTMYDGAIAREEGTMGNNEGPMTDKLRPHYEGYGTDARKLDEGLDCLTRVSIDSYDNTMNPARPGSGIPSHIDNRSQELTDQFPVKNSQDEGSGISQRQPWGVENQLDSSRMQGHRTENVSLGNRETSIVETQPPQNSEVRDFPVGRVIGSNDEGDDHVPATLDGSTWHGHRFNGAGYAPPGQTNGSTPRSQPEMGGNRVVAALSPSPTFPHAKPSVKLSEIRKQLPPVSTGAERASVQRVSSSPGGPLESPVGRPSTSSSRELRPINTSGSSTSPAASKSKVLGARGSSDTSRQYAVSRRSSEASNLLATPLVKTPEVDETQRSFEQLIKSDETIQFTLTPQSVRESESLDSPRYSHNRTATADLADFIRTSGPPPAETAHPSTTRSIVSLKGLNGLRSNPTATSRPAAIQQTPQPPSQSSRPTTAKSVQGPPRDAQSGPETTQDFADFIRSTGPEAVSISHPDEERGLTPSADMPWLFKKSPEQRAASAAKKKITKQNPSASKSPVPVAPTPPPTTRPAPKLQPREPTYGPSHSVHLLNILNRGPLYPQDVEKHQAPSPASSATPQNPHVPTNLRDRFSENTRSSIASTQDSALANNSIRSTNSRTALLDSSRGSLGGSPSLSQIPSRVDEPPQAARKQRRNKDPYALDTDSEDEGRPQTPKGQLEEETLVEFLSRVPPLSHPKPIIPSAFDDLPNPSPRSKNTGKKANGLFHQHNARTAAAAATPGIRSANPAPTSNPQQFSRGRPPSAKAPQLPPFNTRDISPHLISTYTPSTAPPTSGNNINGAATSHLTLPTTTTTAATNPPRKIKPAGVARPDDREDNARTMSDLADFLRNSEPPLQVPREMMAGTGAVEGKESEGRGIWGRLRKRRGRQ